jgi:hypothetical protein
VLFALVYLLLRRVLRRMAGPSNDRMDTEVEVVVLRHQLMVLKHQVANPVFAVASGCSWRRSQGPFLELGGRRSW